MARVGLVLGGGGIVGMAYHGAVLSGIFEATGWDPREAEVVVGTSAGAASGAELRAGLSGQDMAARRGGTPFSREGKRLMMALGPPPQEPPTYVDVDEDRARVAFRRVMTRAVTSVGSVPPGVIVSIAMSPGRLSASWLIRQVQWLNGGDGWPEKQFWTCAVELDSGNRVVFGRASVPPATPGEAVAASCAIPGVFAPVGIGDGLYIDGGGWSTTNADVLTGLGLDLVIVVAPMSVAPGSVLERKDWLIRRSCRASMVGEVARLRGAGTLVATVEPTQADLAAMGRILGSDVLDESRCAAVVEQVRASTVSRVMAGRLPEMRMLAARPPALAA